MGVHHKSSVVSFLCSFLCVFLPISVHGKNEGICERVGWQECKTTSLSRNQRCHILSPHMPSSLLLLLLFWCIFCTVKENRCWFGNPFALFLCLLIGGSTHCFGHVALDRSLAAYPSASHDDGRWCWWWTCTPSVWCWSSGTCRYFNGGGDCNVMVMMMVNCMNDADECSRVLGHPRWRTTKRATSYTELEISFKTDVRE